MIDFDLLEDEEARAPFRFRLAGQEWALPHVADLTLGQQLSIDSGRHVPVFREVGMNADLEPAGEELATALMAIKGSRVGKILAAWLAHAGHEPGGSPASSS